MTNTISIAPDVIRARVQALIAMHLFMDDIDHPVVTDDHNAALNQAIVFAFSRALIRISKWVVDFKIDPTNFHDFPDDLLMLEVTLNIDCDSNVNWQILRRALEEYVSVEVIHEMLPDCRLADTYRQRSDDTLRQLVDLINQYANPAGTYRIKRTI